MLAWLASGSGTVAGVLASLPSPSSNQITLGPLHLRAYGLMIALGVFAAIEISRYRWAQRGGNPDDIYAVALWAVPAGLIGARLYHVITDNELYRGHWLDNPFGAGTSSPLALWHGGLGIPGGIVAGVGVGLWVARRRDMRLPVGLDVVAPAMAVAQAIGRFGNWFNQEIFGRPTTLPWGLEISPVNRPVGYAQYATFHPTFLYEALWNLALAGVLVAIDRRRVLRPGRIFALYIGGYAVGRFLVESLRIDNANRILGLRVNIWTSLLTFAGVALFLAIRGLRRRPDDDYEPYTDGHRFVGPGDDSTGDAVRDDSTGDDAVQDDSTGDDAVQDDPTVGTAGAAPPSAPEQGS